MGIVQVINPLRQFTHVNLLWLAWSKLEHIHEYTLKTDYIPFLKKPITKVAI